MVICKEAQKRLDEAGITLSPVSRNLLGTYDDKAQVGWTTNPWIERIIQQCKWDILHGATTSQGNTNSNIAIAPSKISTSDKKVEIKKVEKKVESSSDSDDNNMFDLFD
jgi:hypothetical protein